MKSKFSVDKLRMFNSPRKIFVGLILFFANMKRNHERPKRHVKKIVVYYRICDKGYPKQKPDYITKEHCLANALQEFPLDKVEWHVLADKVSDKTYEMILKYIPKSSVEKVSVGHGAGTFRMVYEASLKHGDDTLVYFLEDDYLHIPNSLFFLKEAAECNYTDYFTLYDHPDKYSNSQNPYITKGGEESIVYWCGHRHWKQTNSTTMTFAAFADVLRKDKKAFWRWTGGKHPWDFIIFTEIRVIKRKNLSCPLPSCSTHGETEFLANGIEWNKIL